MKNDSQVFTLSYPWDNGAIASMGKTTEEQAGGRGNEGSLVDIRATCQTSYNNNARLSSNVFTYINNCLYNSHNNHMAEKYSHCPHITDQEMKALKG